MQLSEVRQEVTMPVMFVLLCYSSPVFQNWSVVIIISIIY